MSKPGQEWRAARPARESALRDAVRVRYDVEASQTEKAAAEATILAYENAEDLPEATDGR